MKFYILIIFNLSILFFNASDAQAQIYLAPAKKNGKWGFIDQKGNFVIEPRYDNVLPFQEGLAAVNEGFHYAGGNASQCIAGKWGYINMKGELIIPLQFENVESFQEGLAKVNKGATYRNYQGVTLMGGKWGFIEKSGKFFIEPNDTLFTNFTEGLCAFKIPRGSSWGYIDRNKKAVIKPAYYEANFFINGYAPVMLEDFTFQFIGKTGAPVFGRTFRKATVFREERAFVKESDGKPGFINLKGDRIPAPDNLVKDENLKLFYYNGLAKVPFETANGIRYGFIDLSGKWKIQPGYDLADNFHEGLTLVLSDRFYKFIDENGKTVIEVKDSYVENPQTKIIFKAIPNPNIGFFNHGLCKIKEGTLWGFLNTKGILEIKPQFEEVKDFTSAE